MPVTSDTGLRRFGYKNGATVLYSLATKRDIFAGEYVVDMFLDVTSVMSSYAVQIRTLTPFHLKIRSRRELIVERRWVGRSWLRLKNIAWLLLYGKLEVKLPDSALILEG